MKKFLASLVILGLCAVITVRGGEKKPAPKIEGSWTATGGIEKGKKLPAEEVEKNSQVIVFKDGKYRDASMGKLNEAGTYKIDATQNPAAIDFTVIEGKEKGKIQLGIFKIDGNTLTISLADYGSKDRPKNFDGAGEIGVMIFKRNK